MNLPDMSKKVGPFPLYVWLIAGVGGIGLYWYLNRSTSDSGESVEEVESNALTPGVGVGANAGTDNSDTVNTDTNEAWTERAIRFLVDRGTTPLVAQAMLSKYLDGSALSISEQVLLNLVLLQVGRPPYPPTEIPAASDTLNIKKWASPALRKTSNANWNDGRGVASRDYTWIDYLRTHYDNLPEPPEDFRNAVLAGWLQAYNGRVTKVKKGMNVKIPKKLWLKKWPTN